MKRFLLLAILTYAILSRFWMIDKFPPLIYPSLLYWRLISTILSTGIVLLIFFYAKKLFHNTKIALLSAFVFIVLPWTIEQGRIVSQVNNALFIFLFLILAAKFFKNVFLKGMIYLAIPLGIFLVYPQLWLFQKANFLPKLQDFLTNILFLLSADFLFFRNITFWWGGIRESGVLLLSFLPFFILGSYTFFTRVNWEVVVWLLGVLVISAASPFFPESREFFLATPFISLFTALGIYNFWTRKNLLAKIFFLLLFLFMIYDTSSFFHFYTIHYKQQVLSNISQINEPF